MSNPVKSLAKGVRKVFKKVLTPKVAKALVIGAAIFATGAALGVWGTGAAASSSSAALTGGAATGGGAVGAGTVLAPEAVNAGAGVLASSVAPEAALATVAPKTAGYLSSLAAAPEATVASNLAAAAPAKAGIISSLAGKAKSGLEWAQNNPIPSLMLAQGVQSAFSPSEKELMKYKTDLEKDFDQYRRSNMNVAGIQSGQTYGGPISRFVK